MNARYLFFGGKGGVGKTTAASATALFLLQNSNRNDSILLFSTDPAHSLSDSLDLKVGNRLVEVKQLRGRGKLFAYEMDASLALERFRAAHGEVLAEIAERGTLLDEEDIKQLLNLSFLVRRGQATVRRRPPQWSFRHRPSRQKSRSDLGLMGIP